MFRLFCGNAHVLRVRVSMLDDSRQGENSRNYRSTSAFPAAYSGRPIRICEPAIFQLVLLAQRLRIAHILQRRSSVYRRIVGWVAGHIPGLHHATGRSGWGRAERKESTQASGIHLLEERLRHPFKTGRRVPANPGTRRLPFFTSLPMERLSCP
jgi:hypothetical protein